MVCFSVGEIAKGGQIAEFFDQRGYACIEKANISEEKATELAIEINAEEVISAIDDDGEREVWKVSYIIVHTPSSFSKSSSVSWSTDILRANESQSNSTRLYSDIRWIGISSKSNCAHQ